MFTLKRLHLSKLTLIIFPQTFEELLKHSSTLEAASKEKRIVSSSIEGETPSPPSTPRHGTAQPLH